MSRIELPSWYGEFGWEVASWVPWCRKLAEGYDEVIATSFAGMGPLYADFATEFRSHDQTKRSLTYPKRYRVDGKYYRYGRNSCPGGFFDILIHARGINRKGSYNYRRWEEFIEIKKKSLPYTCACIGTKEDLRVADLFDWRGLELQRLMNLIAKARMVVGVSSGLMHLAAFCGTNLVVWGDRRTYFHETLEQRYKITWNPFNVRVGWIDADDFQPEPQEIIEKVREIYEGTAKKYPAAIR